MLRAYEETIASLRHQLQGLRQMNAAQPVDLTEEISARDSTIEHSSNLDKALGQQVNVNLTL
jgi:hypothetical protein